MAEGQKFNYLSLKTTTDFINTKIAQRPIMVFSKSYVPECKETALILESLKVYKGDFEICNIEKRQDCALIETYLMKICNEPCRKVPRIFISHKYFGSYEDLNRIVSSGELKEMINKNHWAASRYKQEYE
ncbi:hypothetical protein HELRODRAFT_167990 [Helobdella robusta]|uniref:Uncharacterized protein n=1 Tax=Helobdella robusta TaxID=6412 RepID=T1F017_HELRO|nr:hypothetical protein HELRODRAFT_167990 [Helobdella robusta]ESO10131.1 hypothetical protein HELRODRAFT_167990 [Helobdella robusta]